MDNMDNTAQRIIIKSLFCNVRIQNENHLFEKKIKMYSFLISEYACPTL